MFDDLTSVFEAVKDCCYVILRNYEEFDHMNFLSSHPDIDILCQTRKDIVDRLGLLPRRKKEDGIHYYVMVGKTKVAVDLRTVGDGYLDAGWERDILAQRVKRQNYYVMKDEHYFYSLLYHVIVQKNKIAEDYVARLENMALRLNVDYSFERREQVLDAYMEKQQYRYTYPEYAGTIFHVENVRKELVERNFGKFCKRKGYAFVRWAGHMLKNRSRRHG